MGGSTFGTLFRVTTAGESHGLGNVVIIDGLPAGLTIDEAAIAKDLERRRPGQSSLVSQRKEPDLPEILSGTFEGRSTGTPLAILVRNKDARSKDYSNIAEVYRPGHADYTFDAKYGFRDYRGGGRSSARETVARVAAGAIAKQLLAQWGVSIQGWVQSVGELSAPECTPESVTAEQVESNPVRCPHPETADKMIELIKRVRSEGDSIGGTARIVATGVPAGWGEPVFDKLKADLGKAMFSLPAVLGVEYGAGFAVARARGSQNNDLFVSTDAGIQTSSNRHGGMLGGISSGMPILVTCAVKPTSSLPKAQDTVDSQGQATSVETRGRHDPCLLPRFVPMAEAMFALVLADHALRQRAAQNPL